MRRSVFAVGAALVLASHAAEAAGPCQRPTDPGGYNGYTYGSAQVSHYDGTNVRIWYTTTGTHAVNPASTQPDMTPDNVVTAAKVADDALAQYETMGFLPPIADPGTGIQCGGDPRLDIYLMHFNAADGDTVAEGCKTSGKATTCWSFGQVESRLETYYGSFELGAHVVIAHELFHSVQDAYDQGLDRFWAEGTAQWAAKSAYPAEMDFEAFLPAFFKDAGKSIDIGGSSVVADYLYGSAIWPEFLTEHVGSGVVPEAFAKEGMLGPPSMLAIDAALPTFQSSIADAYPTFAAWNAATGSRAGTGGYANAKSYPEVALTPFPSSGTAMDIVTGYSVFYYAFDPGAEPQQLTLTADPARIGARAFPLVDGKAALDQISPLPVTANGPTVVVVAGISPKKSDAPFSVVATAIVPDAGVVDAADDVIDADLGDSSVQPDAAEAEDADASSEMDASSPDASQPAPSAAAPSTSPSSGGGCGCEVAGVERGDAWLALAFGLGVVVLRRRRRIA